MSLVCGGVMTWISVCCSVHQSLQVLNVFMTAAGASEVLLCLVRPCQALPFVTTFQPNLVSQCAAPPVLRICVLPTQVTAGQL